MRTCLSDSYTAINKHFCEASESRNSIILSYGSVFRVSVDGAPPDWELQLMTALLVDAEIRPRRGAGEFLSGFQLPSCSSSPLIPSPRSLALRISQHSRYFFRRMVTRLNAFVVAEYSHFSVRNCRPLETLFVSCSCHACPCNNWATLSV